MSKMKAVVLEKSGSQYTVLGKNGAFRRVHRRDNAEVGEEIEIQTGIEIFNGLRAWAGVAALFLMVLTALLGWNLYQAPTAVALLSVDINPSLQFTLDAQGHLLKLQTQNEDAKRMLSQVDLTGKPLDEVIEQIVNQAIRQRYLNSDQHWIVVGYSPLSNKTTIQMPKELNQNQITALVTEKVEKQGFTPQVAVFALNQQERELAQKGDLTLGEYALWQTAQKAGVVTQPKLLKETSERVRVLDNPQVQAQIKEEQKSFEANTPPTPGTAKQNLEPKHQPNEEMRKPTFDELHPSPPWVPKSHDKDLQNEQDQKQTDKEDRADVSATSERSSQTPGRLEYDDAQKNKVKRQNDDTKSSKDIKSRFMNNKTIDRTMKD